MFLRCGSLPCCGSHKIAIPTYTIATATDPGVSVLSRIDREGSTRTVRRRQRTEGEIEPRGWIVSFIS